MQPATLDNYNWGGLDLSHRVPVPVGGFNITAMVGNINPASNSNIDILAPGVRDQIPHPTFPYLGPTQDSLFQGLSNANAPAIVNVDSNLPSFLKTNQNQRWHYNMYQVLRETKDALHPAFQDRGVYNVAPTGFSAFKDLRMSTTSGWQ